jgi:hypothetical protein
VPPESVVGARRSLAQPTISSERRSPFRGEVHRPYREIDSLLGLGDPGIGKVYVADAPEPEQESHGLRKCVLGLMGRIRRREHGAACLEIAQQIVFQIVHSDLLRGRVEQFSFGIGDERHDRVRAMRAVAYLHCRAPAR